jgi:shikimate kinase
VVAIERGLNSIGSVVLGAFIAGFGAAFGLGLAGALSVGLTVAFLRRFFKPGQF